MANHVIYDTLWASRRLRRCSREAAMAYPWIFLVADDHGRFEHDPRGIWSRVFGAREDVSVEEVTRWLAEYEREGLLIRYGHDGELAYWYKFKGRRPSERRPSEHLDPAQLKRRDVTATRPRRDRDATATASPPARDKSTPEVELDQIRSGAEVGRNGADGQAHLPPADRTETAIRKSADGMRSKLYGLIDQMRELDPRGRDPTELMRLVTGYQKADGTAVKGVVNAAMLTFERLEKSIEDAEATIGDWKAAKQ